MQARYPQILASTVMADRRNYSAHIGANAGDYQGAAEAPAAWGRIEDAADGNAPNRTRYADVDVRRHDGEWFSVFADPEPFATRRRGTVISHLCNRLRLVPEQAEDLIAGRVSAYDTAQAHGVDPATVKTVVAHAREQLAAL